MVWHLTSRVNKWPQEHFGLLICGALVGTVAPLTGVSWRHVTMCSWTWPLNFAAMILSLGFSLAQRHELCFYTRMDLSFYGHCKCVSGYTHYTGISPFTSGFEMTMSCHVIWPHGHIHSGVAPLKNKSAVQIFIKTCAPTNLLIKTLLNCVTCV